jgi:hypothetical protein
MHWLTRRGRRRDGTVAAVQAVCLHTSLAPRWTSVADMGQEDRVSGFTCQACNEAFTPAEGRALLDSEATRVRDELLPPE